MNSQRTFWISGAATLAVLLLIGGALLARTQRTAAPAVVAAPALSAQMPAGMGRPQREHERHRERKGEEDDD